MATLSVGADTTGMHALARDMRALDKALLPALRKGLKAAARPVVDAAKANAAGISPHLPATIGTQASFSKSRPGVFIRANAARMPAGKQALPGLFERGRRGGDARAWRHPVFGRNAWVTQATRPYLQPALAAHANGAVQEIVKALNDAARAVHL